MKRAFGIWKSRVRFASYEQSECIVATKLPLHICEANASLPQEPRDELTTLQFCAIIIKKSEL